MRKKDPDHGIGEDGFIDVVHSTEMEIDAYLKGKAAEADELLDEAVRRSEAIREEAERRAGEEVRILEERLRQETSRAAEETIAGAGVLARREAAGIGDRMEEAVQLVIRLVLGEEEA